MSVQRDSKPPVSPRSRELVNDFSGGQNSTINSTLLNKNEAQIAENVSLEQKGTIRPRKGRRKRFTTPFSTSSVSGITGYYKKDGTARLVLAAGNSMYSDLPSSVVVITSKADFDAGTKSRFISTEVFPGSMVLSGSAFGTAGDCVLVTDFTAVDCTLTIDTLIKKYNSTSLKAVIATGKTVGKIRIAIPALMDKSKTWAIRLYGCTEATSLALRTVKADGTVIRSVAMTKSVIPTFGVGEFLAAPADLTDAGFFEIEITGAAGNVSYFDGICAVQGTEFKDYDYAEAVATTKVYNSLNFASGTPSANLDLTSGTLKLKPDFLPQTLSEPSATQTLTNTTYENGITTPVNVSPTWNSFGTATWNSLT